jgi:hypothetical protein
VTYGRFILCVFPVTNVYPDGYPSHQQLIFRANDAYKATLICKLPQIYIYIFLVLLGCDGVRKEKNSNIEKPLKLLNFFQGLNVS